MTILSIQSSINAERSVSRRLAAAVVDQLAAQQPGTPVVVRDLVAEPPTHITGRPDASDPLLQEFLAANTIVVGAPMYNFGVPSQLKAWLDRLAVAGATFNYVDGRPAGACGDKAVIIVSSRAGAFGPDSPIAFMDHQERYVETFFRFIGVTNIKVVRAEGYGGNPEATEQTLIDAVARVPELV